MFRRSGCANTFQILFCLANPLNLSLKLRVLRGDLWPHKRVNEGGRRAAFDFEYFPDHIRQIIVYPNLPSPAFALLSSLSRHFGYSCYVNHFSPL